MVVYESFQLALTGKRFVFWISGRLREVVANESSSQMEVRLYLVSYITTIFTMN